jgi:hypothetical protein
MITTKENVELEDQAADETTQNRLMVISATEFFEFFNPAILSNIRPAVTLLSLSFDTMDKS